MKDPDRIANRIINMGWGFAIAAILYSGTPLIIAIRWW